MMITLPPARESSSGSTPRANSPASAGAFYSGLPNPFAGLGDRPDEWHAVPTGPSADLLPPLDDEPPVDISRVDLMAWVRQLADEVIAQRSAPC